ncbi:MAG TPA: hypothetical protein VM734_27485, partial [Kofleriaceae bacterium]|nr:hypothetical protein [Kofleriaceae bacterium]
MRLRARLAATSVAIALPVVVAMIWLDARERHRAAEASLRAFTLHYLLAPGERARCEAAPASWGGVPLAPPRGHRPPPGHGPRPGGPPP